MGAAAAAIDPIKTVTGQITYIYNISEDGRHSSCRVKTSDGRNICVTGYGLPTHRGILYDFIGELKPKDKAHEPVFFAESATPSDTEDGNETVAWLVGLFSGAGFGAATARKIVDRFGENTRDIIKNNIEKLSEIKGISPAKITKLKEKLESCTGLVPLTELLSPLGFTPGQCATLYSELGDDATAKVRANPYLTVRICHCSFAEADMLAKNIGMADDDPIRLKAGSISVFGAWYMNGSTMMPADTYIRSMLKLLGSKVSKEAVKKYAESCMSEGKLRWRMMEHNGQQSAYIYTSKQANIEDSIAEKAISLSKLPASVPNARERAKEMDASGMLCEEQLDAIEAALSSSFSIITGGPGTGKTTVMKSVASLYEISKGNDTGYPMHTVLLAPTGRAARRLSESTGMEAHTIHHYFRVFDTELRHADQELPPIENKLVIVDEASMMDSSVSEIIFSKIGKGSSLVLVGDTDQLPSVGPGAVLRDLIASGLFRTVNLKEVHRADGNSLIVANTRKVNAGDTALIPGADFHPHMEDNDDDMHTLIGRLYIKRAAEYGIQNVALLVPYRKGMLGVEELNKYIQSLVNKSRDEKNDLKKGLYTYRVGDPVMHTGSNTPEASNGDIGVVEEVNPTAGSVKARINGKLLEYSGADLVSLHLAYACTVHKSQGSESKSVITCISSSHSAMLIRNIPYVAFSRAKKELDVIYDKAGLETAIKTCKSDQRMTLLPFFLKARSGQGIPA